MKTIEINKKKYQLPTKLEEITINQFLIIQEIINSDISNLQKYLQVISYLSNIPESILRDTGTELINPILDTIDFLSNTNLEDFDSITEFEYLGETFYVNQNFSESCFGEYIDYDNFLKEYGSLNSIPYILAVLCKKKDEKYSTYDVLARAESFKNLPATIALAIANFFLLRKQALNLDIMYCSLLQVQAQDKINECKNSVKNMDGMGLFKRLQKKMLLKNLQYYQRLLDRFSIS